MYYATITNLKAPLYLRTILNSCVYIIAVSILSSFFLNALRIIILYAKI